MAREVNRLSDLEIKALTKPGLYNDGFGLHLQVGQSGTKSWAFRYSFKKKARQMGLGTYRLVSLKAAREAALAMGRIIHSGVDPLAAKAAAKVAAANVLTFKQATQKWVATHEVGWKSKQASQIRAALETYAFPTIGDLAVHEVETKHITTILDPIWTTKNSTAGRIRAWIESVLDWAASKGHRPENAPNPARWTGHIEHSFPASAKITKVRHHPAVPFADLPEVMACLRAMTTISARALEFTVLTAARTGEVVYAVADEIDFKTCVWTVPAERMKSEREHKVPLCARAIEILETTPREKGSALLFSGFSRRGSMSDTAMLNLLRKIEGCKNYTVHGMRSTFRDWAGDMTTDFPRDVIEMALAHKIRDSTEAAYRRGSALEKRTHLMSAWGKYCEAGALEEGATVIPIRAAR